MIQGYKLQSFLQKERELEKFDSPEDEENGKVTDTYSRWEQQDQLLVSWLLSSVNADMVNCMVGCGHEHQISERTKVFFASQTLSKVKQFKAQLRDTKKRESDMNEYLLKIKKIIDNLASMGYSMTVQDQVQAIVDGLPTAYDLLIMLIATRVEPCLVADIEALLMAHEERSKKQRKKLDVVTSNLAHTTLKNANLEQVQSYVRVASGRGGQFNRGRGYGRGRWQGNQVICQLCGRPGHES